MTRAALINALLYELAKWLIQRKPALAFSPLVIRLLAWCRPDWEQWKVDRAMESVDKQTVELVEQWEKEERTEKATVLVEQAKALCPQAKITALPDAVVPSIMIEQEATEESSDDVKALGGEMRITSFVNALEVNNSSSCLKNTGITPCDSKSAS
jgi:hypothetical protein